MSHNAVHILYPSHLNGLKLLKNGMKDNRPNKIYIFLKKKLKKYLIRKIAQKIFLKF